VLDVGLVTRRDPPLQCCCQEALMTRYASAIAALLFALLVVAAPLAQAPQGAAAGQGRQGGDRGPTAPACETLACEVLADWERTRTLIIGIADAMPADAYGFRTTPPQRTFGEHLMHIVQVDRFLLGALGARTQPPPIDMTATSKADVMAALRQSFDYGAAVMREFTDAQLLEHVTAPPFLGPTASRLRIYYYDLQHTQDTYGQRVVYLRLNGITPPASVRGV
jgi:uncharacterized damage-inducible protein DinB